MSAGGETRRAKTPDIESAFTRLSDKLLDQIDEVGRSHDYSGEFREGIRAWFGDDMLDIYDEWVAEGQSLGVPQ